MAKQSKLLRFLDARPYDGLDIRAIEESLKTMGLIVPVRAFRKNVHRLKSLLALPVQTAYFVARFDLAFLEAINNVCPKWITNRPAEGSAKDREIMAERWRFFSEALKEPDDVQLGENAYTMATGTGGYDAYQGQEALLIAQITGAWTAFEVLARDLWETAVNIQPQGLADLRGKLFGTGKKGVSAQKRLVGDDDTEEEADLRISRRFMQEHCDKIGEMLGSALLSTKNNLCDFTSLRGIQGSYAKAFAREPSPNFLMDVLDDPALERLSVLRNVLVHHAGDADREFLEKNRERDGKKLLPEFANVPLDGKILVTGSVVNAVVRPAVEACLTLIKRVDAWLTSRRRE